VRRDALHNREKILTVAAELMSLRGSNVRLAEIAEAAGFAITGAESFWSLPVTLHIRSRRIGRPSREGSG